MLYVATSAAQFRRATGMVDLSVAIPGCNGEHGYSREGEEGDGTPFSGEFLGW